MARNQSSDTFTIRIPKTLMARLEYLVRNHEAVESKTQAGRNAVRMYVEVYEKDLERRGFKPPK